MLKKVDEKIASAWTVLGLILAVIVVFSPCLNNQFVNFDDPDYITENSTVRSFSSGSIQKIFSSTTLGSYVPLTVLSFAGERQWFGPSPVVVHLNNVLLHALNAALVFLLIRYMTRDLWVSVLCALFFAVNPLRVESVAWASQRKDVLHAFFYLAGLLCYVRGNSGSCRYVAAVYPLFVLACLSKPQAITFPLALLMLDLYKNNKITLNDIKNKVFYFLTSAVYFVVTFNAAVKNTALNSPISVWDKLVLTGYSLSVYLAKIVFPLSLSALYPAPQKIDGFFALDVYCSAAFAVILIIVSVLLLVKRHAWAWGLLFFTALIALALGHIWSAGVPLSDRFTYLPSIGIAFVMAQASVSLIGAFSNGAFKSMILIFVMGYLSFLGVFTYNRCAVWKDSLSLWNDVIRQYPQIAVAYNNRGNVFNRQGLLDKALGDYDKAIGLDPKNALALNNKGVVLYKSGKFHEAVEVFNETIRLDPNNLEAYNNRAGSYFMMGNFEQALEDIEHVLSKDPFRVNALANREKIRKAMGR